MKIFIKNTMVVSVRTVVVVVVLFIISATGYAEEEEKSPPELEYLSLGSKIIVNLEGRKKYIRVEVQLLVDGKDNVEIITNHIPALRHSLIMLFSKYTSDQMTTSDQREQLRGRTLQEVRTSMKKYGHSDDIHDLFFTEFLVQ